MVLIVIISVSFLLTCVFTLLAMASNEYRADSEMLDFEEGSGE